LGPTDVTRAEAYRAFVAQGCAQMEADEIRSMTSKQRAFGGKTFKEELERVHQRPMGLVKFGRPRLQPES